MMRYPTEREKEMNRLRVYFLEYIADCERGLAYATLRSDAPQEAKDALEKWQKLCREQKEEDDKWPFAH